MLAGGGVGAESENTGWLAAMRRLCRSSRQTDVQYCVGGSATPMTGRKPRSKAAPSPMMTEFVRFSRSQASEGRKGQTGQRARRLVGFKGVAQ